MMLARFAVAMLALTMLATAISMSAAQSPSPAYLDDVVRVR